MLIDSETNLLGLIIEKNREVIRSMLSIRLAPPGIPPDVTRF